MVKNTTHRLGRIICGHEPKFAPQTSGFPRPSQPRSQGEKTPRDGSRCANGVGGATIIAPNCPKIQKNGSSLAVTVQVSKAAQSLSRFRQARKHAILSAVNVTRRSTATWCPRSAHDSILPRIAPRVARPSRRAVPLRSVPDAQSDLVRGFRHTQWPDRG